MSDVTQNKFKVKDSLTLIDEMLTQDSDLYMTSLNLDSLFTNIPLDETIGICLNKLFQNPKTSVNGISKNDFCDLQNLATKEPTITFKSKFYI